MEAENKAPNDGGLSRRRALGLFGGVGAGAAAAALTSTAARATALTHGENGHSGHSSPTYVLIPGAWHGAWSWEPVAKRLRAAGRRAVALTLPGLGYEDDPAGLRLEDAIDHVVRQVKKLSGKNVIMVCHSWGGYPTTGAAARLRNQVTEVVYFSAYVPRPNTSSVAENPPEVRALIEQIISSSPGRAWTAGLEDVVKPLLLPGFPEEAQRMLLELLTPQPGAYMLDVLRAPLVTDLGIRARYLLAGNDTALPRPGAEFAARLGLKPEIIPGLTHEGMITHPDEVAQAVLRANA
ncbi:alpha/beta fold hydrolase [Nonomuraea terrae]|uniref:alpha/beta fold hydrolase n=1 Tax=Nonomuraea terrae TaxID=2530383 RepID=UPI0037964298